MTTIVFSHGNGFPAGTYRQLFERWRAAGFEVRAVEKYGHDPRFPVTSNWPHLRDELIAFVERCNGPAWLVGHSLGGYLSLMAASRRPDLALGVVLLDSPVVAGWRARAVQLAKATGLAARLSPGAVSKRRRQHWDDPEAAFAHFAAKPVFARWSPGVLRDYITSGIEPDLASRGAPSGRAHRLSFDRAVETAIYDNLPHQFPRLLARHPLRCPLAFVRGSESREVRQVGLAMTARLAHGRISSVDGTHLFPFERPAETAAEVLRWIALLADSPPAAQTGR